MTRKNPGVRNVVAAGLAGLLGLVTMVEAAGFRITLALSGDACDRRRDAIETALKQLPGVRAVDFRSIPGHVLVDVDRGSVTPDQLATAVNSTASPGGPCRAEEMKSCVTAGSPR